MISSNGNKVVVTALTLVIVGYLGWLGVTVVQIKTKVDSTAIPTSTEQALNEIRMRMNEEQTERVSLHELAVMNNRDITYVRESIDRINRKLDDHQSKP